VTIRFEIPIKTVSGLNAREHHFVRAKRVKSERRATAYRIPKAVKELRPMISIHLVRRSPRFLDRDDNLPSAMKGVRDQIACALGVNDRSHLVQWTYGQEKGEPAVLVSIDINWPRTLVTVEAG
jgi:hypothetical protein